MSTTLAIVPAEAAPDSELAEKGSTILTVARATNVRTPQEAEAAAYTLTSVIKPFKARVTDFFKPLKQSADAAKKALLDAEKSLLGPATEAETIIKGKLATFASEEEARRKAAAELAAKAVSDAPAMAAVLPFSSGPVKVAGVSFRETWRAEVTDLGAFLVWVAADLKNRSGYVLPNPDALGAWAKATKGAFPIPGVEAVSENIVAAGRS